MGLRPDFWLHFKLADMTADEWEAVCDGCGLCCLHKLEDMDTGEIYFTDVACQLLDLHACQCKDYLHRRQIVPDCIKLSLQDLADYDWLPQTCAYRLLASGHALPSWHHLVCGDVEAVHRAGISARGRCISEQDTRNLEARIVQWWS